MKFRGRFISQRGDIDWKPKSYDLNPIRLYSLWLFEAKDLCLQTIKDSRVNKNMKRVIIELKPHLTVSITESFAKRMVVCF